MKYQSQAGSDRTCGGRVLVRTKDKDERTKFRLYASVIPITIRKWLYLHQRRCESGALMDIVKITGYVYLGCAT